MTRTLRILESASVDAVPPAEAASVESDFVVILAALLCALICVVGLIAVARCAWLRRGPVAGGASPRRQALANRGLKKKVLNSLPKFTYGGGKDSSDDGDKSKWVVSSECAICLAEFAAADEVRVLPQCGHGFHVACIDTWLGSHSSCPSCRALLVVAVTRCQKCGQFPAVAGGGVAMVAVVGGTESKTTAGGGNVGAAANCSNSNNVNYDFLP